MADRDKVSEHSLDTVDTAVNIAVMRERLATLEEDQTKVASKLDALEKYKESALKAGIILLGSALLTLAGFVLKTYILINPPPLH